MNVSLIGWPPPSGVVLDGWGVEPSSMRMPGRVQGFPAGSQRVDGEAQRLLSTAVAYWDASKYRPGDRFLRNQGVAGELLDLRLGSSVVANTNDPLYLAPEATGFCYLPGVSGNSLTVSPDLAAQSGTTIQRFQVACDNLSTNPYLWRILGSDVSIRLLSDGRVRLTRGNLVDSTSPVPGLSTGAWLEVEYVTSTGAVTFRSSSDGVTWTSIGTGTTTTTGDIIAGAAEVGTLSPFFGGYIRRWQTIVDGTTVLDVDCDAITSGSATSFLAATGQTVTINRSTSGRKTVAMPSRWNGGSPCFLFGTDDYMEVQDAWQHQLLNFRQGDSFTVLAVVRQWATAVNNGRYISKRGAPSSWLISTTTTQVYAYVEDQSSVTSNPLVNQSAGIIQMFAMIRNRNQRTLTMSSNSNTSSTADATRDLSNLLAVRIGRETGSATNYQDFEFTAAAVFRRALSAQEVQLITSYYTGASA